jgi:hypothetical protein
MNQTQKPIQVAFLHTGTNGDVLARTYEARFNAEGLKYKFNYS